MLRFTFGFLLGIALSNAYSVKAQEPVTEVPIHSSDLTVKEIIEILGQFDVKHADQQPFFHPAYGATAFDTTPPAVWIFNTADMQSKYSTLIHEFTHIHCHNIGVNCSEEYVESEEKRQFQRIFGVTP